MLPLNANALGYLWRLINSGDYTAIVVAESTGGGTVYVEGAQSSGTESTSAKGTSTYQGELTFEVTATTNKGYTWAGWGLTETGVPTITANPYNYVVNAGTQRVYDQDHLQDYSATYRIYAFFNPIPYTMQFAPGDHGSGTMSNLSYTASYTGNLPSSTFAADPGYSFYRWKATAVDTSQDCYWTLNQNYTTSTSLSGKYGNVTMTAQWQAKSYTITYNGNGGSVSGYGSSTSYNIENATTLRTASRNKYTFYGWKVTSIADPAECNWSVGDVIPYNGSSPVVPAGKYGNITLTAQWEPLPTDIIISVTGLQNGESAIFTVSKGGTVLYTVSLDSSNTSVTIKNQEIGQYTVTPVTAWSFAYTMSSAQTKTISDTDHTFNFSATPKSGAKKRDEKSNTNWKP